MSKPTTITTEEMLNWLGIWISECVPDKDNEPCETCTKKDPEKSRRCADTEDAIRSLLLAVGEWKKRSSKMLPHGTYVCDGQRAADLIVDIRDFVGEEK